MPRSTSVVPSWRSKRRDDLRNRRLGVFEPVGGSRERAGFGDRLENAKLFQFHSYMECYRSHLFLAEMMAVCESHLRQHDSQPEGGRRNTETATKPYRVAPAKASPTSGGRPAASPSRRGAETGNTFSQIEIDDPRGSGPPLHVHHNEDETFYVLEGEVTIFVGDERIDLEAGDYCFGPRGIPHAYLVRSERARMLVTISPRAPSRSSSLSASPSRRRAPDRYGDAADARAGAPVRSLRRRDPRPAALARRPLVAPGTPSQLASEVAQWDRAVFTYGPKSRWLQKRECGPGAV